MRIKSFLLINSAFLAALFPNFTGLAKNLEPNYIHSIKMNFQQNELKDLYISLNVGHIDYDITFCSQTVEISTLTIRKVKSGDTLDIDSKLIPEGYDCMLVYFSHKGDSIRVGFTLTAKNGKYVSSYPKATEVYLTGV